MTGRAIIRLPTLLIVSLAPRCDNVERRVCERHSSQVGRWAGTAFLALGVLLLAACEDTGRDSTQGDGEPESPPIVVDAAGRQHPTSPLPSRIVSLVPAATSVLTDLGAGERIVGRTDADTASAVSSLPSVGGTAPDLATLEALQPDFVIRLLDSPPALVGRLDALGIPHFALRAGAVEDARQMIRDLGFLSGRARVAEMLLSGIDAALATVREVVGPLPPVRAVYVETAGSMRVAGPGTLIHELIRSGGGVNVFADITALFEPVTLEAIAARQPDVYLVPEGVELDPALTRGTPVRTLKSVVTVPGAHLAAAVFEVARALHPAAFP